MIKTHVAMGYEQCPVCGEKHNESVLLDIRLKETFEYGESLFTGFSLCPEHQQERAEGYVFIIAVDGEDNLPQDKAAVFHEEDFRDTFGEMEMNEYGIFLMNLEEFEETFEQEVTVH